MLGGWLRYEKAGSGATGKPREPPALVDRAAAAKKRSRGVRYTMTSPTVEKYLRLKLEHPQAVVFVTVGAFCQSFFEDAVECGRLLRIAVRDLAANSQAEKILTCGIPKAKLEKYCTLLRQAGREVHVE
jgi:DNA mismatch repair protein MutS